MLTDEERKLVAEGKIEDAVKLEDVCDECREAEEEEMNAKDAVLAYCMGLLI